MRHTPTPAPLGRRVVFPFVFSPLALLAVAVGCQQNQGAGASAGTKRTATVTETQSASAPSDAQTASARQSAAPSRGGSSPANSVAPDRPDGGTDRRTQAQGQGLRNSFAFPTGDRATSVVMLEADTPQQVRVGQPYNYTLRLTNLTDTPVHGVSVYDAT